MALVKWMHLRQLTPLVEIIAGLEGGAPRRQMPAPARPAAAPSAPARTPEPQNPRTSEPQNPRTSEPGSPGTGSVGSDPKSALLAAIRERNRVFYSMVVAQAKSVEVEADTIVFTFAPVHKTLRAEFDRQSGWIQELARSVSSLPLRVAAREGASAPSAAPDPAAERKAELTARARTEPAVQAVLDVFGGTIEDVEEIQ